MTLGPIRRLAAGSVCLAIVVLALADPAAAQEGLLDDEFEIFLQEQQDGGEAAQPPGRGQPSRPGAGTPAPTRQPPAADSQRSPQPSRSAITGRQAAFLLASAPNMFGDFFGGGPALVTLGGEPVMFAQSITDGRGLNLQVFNDLGQPGAAFDPNVPITIFADGVEVTQSIGPGEDTSGDQQPDRYPIADPAAFAPGGPLGPALPGPGTIVFNGGVAVFTGAPTQEPTEPPPGPTDPLGLGEGEDFPTGNDGSVGSADGWTLAFSHTFTPDAVSVFVPNGGGSGVRRIKISEDNSPQPRSRVFWNYNFFNDVFGGVGDVNRYVFGIEHAFWNNQASIEVRAPMAGTLASEQIAVDGAALRDTEFGNMTFTYKHVLIQGDRGLLAAGLGVAIPTGDDARLSLPAGPTIMTIDNESVHLLPYAAILSNATERLFWQAFVQLDIDANGNPVRADVTGANVAPIGVFQDATLLFVDVGMGYRAHQDPNGAVTQISPVAELHYATTLQDIDTVAGGGLTVQGLSDRFDVLNLTLGVDFATRGMVNIRPAMAIPLTGGSGDQFDYEAMLQVNMGY